MIGPGGGRIVGLLVGVGLVVGGTVYPEPGSVPAGAPPPAQTTTTVASTTTTPTAAPAPATTIVLPQSPPPTPAVVAIVDPDGVIRTVTPMLEGAPTVALTFDDGPDPTWTPQVLTILKAAGVRATFCVIGLSVARHPDLVRAIAADGHVLCDHTRNHDQRLSHRSPETIEAQLRAGAEDIERVVGTRPGFYRAPGGNLSPVVIETANRLGMQVLGWSDDPKDWRRPPSTRITDDIAGSLRPGAIVLMHDGGGDRSGTVAQLPALLERVKAMGYRFVTP